MPDSAHRAHRAPVSVGGTPSAVRHRTPLRRAAAMHGPGPGCVLAVASSAMSSAPPPPGPRPMRTTGPAPTPCSAHSAPKTSGRGAAGAGHLFAERRRTPSRGRLGGVLRATGGTSPSRARLLEIEATAARMRRHAPPPPCTASAGRRTEPGRCERQPERRWRWRPGAGRSGGARSRRTSSRRCVPVRPVSAPAATLPASAADGPRAQQHVQHWQR